MSVLVPSDGQGIVADAIRPVSPIAFFQVTIAFPKFSGISSVGVVISNKNCCVCPTCNQIPNSFSSSPVAVYCVSTLSSSSSS